MREKCARVRRKLTAILNCLFERALMNAERWPNGRKDLLACDPYDQPGNKSGNNAQNDSQHKLSFFGLVAPNSDLISVGIFNGEEVPIRSVLFADGHQSS